MMMTVNAELGFYDDGFYEDDEPVADVMAAFEAGEKFVTRAPRGGTRTLPLQGNAAADFVSPHEVNRAVAC